MRPLRDLLATWENWSAREVTRRALANATTGHQREVMRDAVDQGDYVDPLNVLRDTTELMSLLAGWRWQVVYAARVQGATWEEIATATGRSVEVTRDSYVAAIGHQMKYRAIDGEQYYKIL